MLGEEIWRKFPFAGGMKPMAADLADLVLNRTWRPMLAVTGAEGLPLPANAGNVLRPKTALALSLRLPPTVKAERGRVAAEDAAREGPALRREGVVRVRTGRDRLACAA